MPILKLDFLVIPTYNVNTLAIIDASSYVTPPTILDSPTVEINVPGFGVAIIPFTINNFNIFTSANLGITAIGVTHPLPDGVYHIKYSITPANVNFVEHSIMRVDKIQEKFDGAFMKLNMMECDGEIKKQASVELNSIYYFIQGAVAAANNCAIVNATKLYNQADKLLNSFIKNDCNCSGNNYI